MRLLTPPRWPHKLDQQHLMWLNNHFYHKLGLKKWWRWTIKGIHFSRWLMSHGRYSLPWKLCLNLQLWYPGYFFERKMCAWTCYNLSLDFIYPIFSRTYGLFLTYFDLNESFIQSLSLKVFDSTGLEGRWKLLSIYLGARSFWI